MYIIFKSEIVAIEILHLEKHDMTLDEPNLSGLWNIRAPGSSSRVERGAAASHREGGADSTTTLGFLGDF